MAVNLQDTLSRLRSKSVVLIERYNALAVEKANVVQQNEELVKECNLLKKKLLKSQTEIEYLKLAQSISPNAEELARNKAIISKLVRDVDKCIAQLLD